MSLNLSQKQLTQLAEYNGVSKTVIAKQDQQAITKTNNNVAHKPETKEQTTSQRFLQQLTSYIY